MCCVQRYDTRTRQLLSRSGVGLNSVDTKRSLCRLRARDHLARARRTGDVPCPPPLSHGLGVRVQHVRHDGIEPANRPEAVDERRPESALCGPAVEPALTAFADRMLEAVDASGEIVQKARRQAMSNELSR